MISKACGQSLKGTPVVRLVSRRGWLITLPLIAAIALAGPARAASDAARATVTPYGNAVTAVSVNRAWVVAGGPGAVFGWNGKQWSQEPVPPSVNLLVFLNGVAAGSTRDAWAVGGGPKFPVILHWDGQTWEREPSPRIQASLNGAGAVSADSGWAVGGLCPGGNCEAGGTLILRLTGGSWTRVASPGPAGSVLNAVASVSPTDAWAVGGTVLGTFIVHWNGRKWTRVPCPSPPYSVLSGVAATSARNAWAVGSGPSQPLILHWNGETWRQVRVPAPAQGLLSAVAATSASNAWAVGTATAGSGLIEHWNGRSWKVMKLPSGTSDLTGVAAVSAGYAWAVGSGVLRWNGTAWK
jgi:hypothetical protein